MSLLKKREKKKVILSFLFLQQPNPLSYILKLRDYERMGTKQMLILEANKKKQIPFLIIEKTVSLSPHNKKGQICSSITSNLFHQLHPIKVGAVRHQVPPATSSIDPKKPVLSSCSNGSLEIELGWGAQCYILVFALKVHLLSMTHFHN